MANSKKKATRKKDDFKSFNKSRTPPQGLMVGGIGNSTDILDLNFEEENTMIIGNEDYNYHVVTVPNADIKSKTKVTKFNERVQSWLNPFTLRDLISDLEKSKSQFYPALGYIDDSGIIIIIDGSRRRMACHYVGLDYDINVLSRKPTDDFLKSLSVSSNLSKHTSLLEKGFGFNLMFKSGISQQEIAKLTNNTERCVSLGIRANNLPDLLISIFPYPSELGFILIGKLIKISDKNNFYNKEKELLIIKEQIENDDSSKSLKNATCLNKINKLFPNTTAKNPSSFKELKNKVKYKFNQSKSGGIILELKGLETNEEGVNLRLDLINFLKEHNINL